MRFFVLVLSMLISVSNVVVAQRLEEPHSSVLADYAVRPYDECLDAMVQIDEAVAKASAEGKRVICQVGGNWCIWCLRFADFITKDEEIKSFIDNNFIYIHVNTSKNNRNEKALARLGNNKLGYPHLVLLDGNGEVVRAYPTGDLEENQSYSREKVSNFFHSIATWSDK